MITDLLRHLGFPSFLFHLKNIISAWLESSTRNDEIHVFLTSFKNSISSCKNHLKSIHQFSEFLPTDWYCFLYWLAKLVSRVVRFECTILKIYTFQWCVVVFTWLSSFVSNSTNYDFLSLAFSVLILFLDNIKEMGIY